MKLVWMGMMCLAASVTFAAETEVKYDTQERTVVVDKSADRNWKAYNANEFEFSLFGTGTTGEDQRRTHNHDRIERDGKLGAGVGIGYFFNRYIGIEGYAYSESTGGDHFVDQVSGDLVGRFPICNSGVAPYAFVGGGRQFDPEIQWTMDAGGGVQWRFLNHCAVFVDARYVWADETKDYGLGRLGFKFGF